jgi:ketosteroid isomerase-like protein
MKTLISLLALAFCAECSFAQSQNTETVIRTLEQAEVKAVLAKDSVTLLKLWDKDYVVNSPDNVVVFPGKTTLDRPVLKRARVSFTREVEQVIIKGDVAFAMGNETVVTASQTLKRRYTNIWMQKAGSWQLVARHASIICPPK